MTIRKEEENIINYLLTSPTEEIFLDIIYDENYFINNVSLVIMNRKDKEDVFHQIKNIPVRKFLGTSGLIKALSIILRHIKSKKDLTSYFEGDIVNLVTYIFEDINRLKESSLKVITQQGFLKKRKLMERFNIEYGSI